MKQTWPLVDGFATTRHPLYQTWYGMLSRCERTGHVGYKYYGGRGIKVCERWRSFTVFVEDVGLPPRAGYTLDRKDPDGNYEPGNVRWAPRIVQANNKRPRVLLPKMIRISCPAHTALRDVMTEFVISQSKLATICGISQPSVQGWMTGVNRPDHHFRLAIERLYGIPSVDWMTDAEWLIAFGSPRIADVAAQ